MKLLALALSLVFGGALGAQQRYITNDDVVRMSESGVSPDIIIKTIADAAIRFDVSPDYLIGLKKASVPDEVVRAMMARVRESQKIPAPTVPADPIANANQSLAKFEMDQPPVIMPSLGVRPSTVTVNPMDKADAGKIRVSPPNLNQMAPVVPSAEPGTYGLRSGSVAGFGAAGVAYSSGVTGVHPTFGGGLEVGLSRYFGVFGEGGNRESQFGALCWRRGASRQQSFSLRSLCEGRNGVWSGVRLSSRLRRFDGGASDCCGCRASCVSQSSRRHRSTSLGPSFHW
jgi:hypothetical protein